MSVCRLRFSIKRYGGAVSCALKLQPWCLDYIWNMDFYQCGNRKCFTNVSSGEKCQRFELMNVVFNRSCKFLIGQHFTKKPRPPSTTMPVHLIRSVKTRQFTKAVLRISRVFRYVSSQRLAFYKPKSFRVVKMNNNNKLPETERVATTT